MNISQTIQKSYSKNLERSWYNKLKKPSWAPKPKTIGTIWTILYPIIILTYAYVIYRAIIGEISWVVTIPFFLNIAANLAFTPLLFGFKNLKLALADIILVWVTILWIFFYCASLSFSSVASDSLFYLGYYCNNTTNTNHFS